MKSGHSRHWNVGQQQSLPINQTVSLRDSSAWKHSVRENKQFPTAHTYSGSDCCVANSETAVTTFKFGVNFIDLR